MLLKVSTYNLSRVNPSLGWFRQAWQAVSHGLQQFAQFVTQPNELRIRVRQTRDGRTLWTAYDPDNGRSAIFSSEEDLLIWLDNRYHNSGDSSLDLSQKLALTYPLATFR
ncbi:MAG: hypothetical protein HC818_07435 [Synechococcaceae cyanobacterium RM1_1_27]|nr:hypothetical protein [Synechococcaceae cyanobacterium SM2_3_2]NJO86367.1 hypothetical protein [Synechococcaceae cyanobacterium RM1_1_27]